MKKSNVTKILTAISFCMIIASCSKKEDPIEKFTGTFSGTYGERDCGNGGQTQGLIDISDVQLRITQLTETRAELRCSHSQLGTLFTVEGEVSSDTTLMILPVVLDGRDFTGEFIHRRNSTNYRGLDLFDEAINCTFLGDPAPNVWFGTY